jgi:hypothetical protein
MSIPVDTVKERNGRDQPTSQPANSRRKREGMMERKGEEIESGSASRDDLVLIILHWVHSLGGSHLS